MAQFPFRKVDQDKGLLLIQSERIKNIVFSHGTYQVEVYDPEENETFWPFLQLDDTGELLDSFCTCKDAEVGRSCPHLGAAFLFITKGGPLHIRFQTSFWNQLGIMAFKRHGIDPTILKKKEDGNYSIESSSGGQTLFFIQPKTNVGKKFLSEMIFHRPQETEETSIKFSKLSQEELTLWKRGTPSRQLEYELSFWSDLAKHLMLLQEFQASYSISFSNGNNKIPTQTNLFFPDYDLGFYIAAVNWPEIIPSLLGVKSPLVVHELQDVEIRKMTYDPHLKEIRIISHKSDQSKKGEGIKIGDWHYFPNDGFYPSFINPLLKKKRIQADEIGQFIEQNKTIIQKYLVGTTIHLDPIKPKYHLYFDQQQALHIDSYAFQVGDFTLGETTFFYPWVYFQDFGFYPLEKGEFDGLTTEISKEEIGDFIFQHRHWLNQCNGFQIQSSTVEFHLGYRFDDLKTLRFESDTRLFDGSGEMIDFGDWLYIKDKGFYKKLRARGVTKIFPGLTINHSQISLFIHAHREELEQVRKFFSPRCPIENAGLTILFTADKKITVKPEYFYSPQYIDKKVHFFGDFLFVPGEGFSEIPTAAKLPAKYRIPVVIDDEEEAYFVTVELPKLKPFIYHIDKRLKKTEKLTLKVNQMEKDSKFPGKQWIASLTYLTEFGEVGLGTLKENLDLNRSYAITEAGLVFFKDSRFNWLRELSDKRLSTDQKSLKMSTLEWIRLRTFEKIEIPKGKTKTDEQTRLFLSQIDSFETTDTINLEGLKSQLRPYQEVGVKWLWFLYSYGLSGLLCDDMGLGKTHQAMALIAAAYNANLGQKMRYFVVCPTSVIYHWEELLHRFIPHLKIVVFYGVQRTLEAFNDEADLLLTSYGTLRSEKKALSKIPFEIAIFDEIQTAKNIHSQTHHSLSMLKAKTKIGLSGTPIENHLSELKALFDIILPTYFPSLTQFREVFINPIEKYGDPEKKFLLSKLVHPFILRRKKNEVLHDLPEKIEEIAHCTLSEEQQMLYKEAFLKSREKIMVEINDSKKQVPFLHVFALLNTLKQICDHPCLINKNLKGYGNHQSGKWDLFVELLQEARESGQKLVVFTQFLDMMTIIENYLKDHHIGYASIRGATTDRKKQLELFRDDPKCEVFVASLKAAGTGIDLTAGSVVIHYDRWWNPAKENQATDRVHRIGQNRGVQVFKMVTKNSIEEHIHQLIQRKENLLQGIIGYDDQDQIKHLDRDDLILLFNQLNQEFGI